MKRVRNIGPAVVLSSGLACAMLVTSPAAFAATGAAGTDVRISTGAQQTEFRSEPPRGDYARGYDDGRMQGVTDGTHDADVDCQKHKKMSPRSDSDYQRGWEAGYGAGYEFGYNKEYDKKCKSGSSHK